MSRLNRRLRSRLADMHSYCRPHGSSAENEFRRVYLDPFKPNRDPFGNLHVRIGASRILFSCHTDTVARTSGRQAVFVDRTDTLRLTQSAKAVPGACLGADDTVGVFLMREMILAGVPGHYVFHYGEEAGCLGSRSIARHRADFLTQFDAAIAFDRKDFADVITHQCGYRTASDEFADALAGRLNRTTGFRYARSDRGLYTDTNSYADLVPECTNISIGYDSAHGANESVDVGHVLRLRLALLTVDWDALPIARDPAVDDDDWDDWDAEDLTLPVATGTPGRVIFTTTDRRAFPNYRSPAVRPLWATQDAPESLIWSTEDHDPDVPDRPTGLQDVIFLCEACGLEFFSEESNADEKLHFCSTECEEFTRGRG